MQRHKKWGKALTKGGLPIRKLHAFGSMQTLHAKTWKKKKRLQQWEETLQGHEQKKKKSQGQEKTPSSFMNSHCPHFQNRCLTQPTWNKRDEGQEDYLGLWRAWLSLVRAKGRHFRSPTSGHGWGLRSVLVGILCSLFHVWVWERKKISPKLPQGLKSPLHFLVSWPF